MSAGYFGGFNHGMTTTAAAMSRATNPPTNRKRPVRDFVVLVDFGAAAPGCHDFREATGPVAAGFGLFAPVLCFHPPGLSVAIVGPSLGTTCGTS